MTKKVYRQRPQCSLWAKMLSANQIAWFLNEMFFWSKLSKSGLRTLKCTLSQE